MDNEKLRFVVSVAQEDDLLVVSSVYPEDERMPEAVLQAAAEALDYGLAWSSKRHPETGWSLISCAQGRLDMITRDLRARILEESKVEFQILLLPLFPATPGGTEVQGALIERVPEEKAPEEGRGEDVKVSPEPARRPLLDRIEEGFITTPNLPRIQTPELKAPLVEKTLRHFRWKFLLF